jgi:hypothetical protein
VWGNGCVESVYRYICGMAVHNYVLGGQHVSRRVKDMPWESRTQQYWTVCWKWGFIPYPCKKTKPVYCCTGRWKQRCYLFLGEQWLCCNGREYHYWVPCFGIGDIVSESKTVCRDSIPSDSRDGCPTTVGDAPPGSVPGSNTVRAAVRIGSGCVFGTLVGALIAAATGSGATGGAIGGAIVGALFGAGSGRKWGCLLTLIALLAVILVLALMRTG